MEISTILSADILDIIFEGRNKEYGAYDLRRSYRRRLTISITVMLLLIGLLLLGYFLAGKPVMQTARTFEIPETTLENIKPEEEVVPPPPPKQTPPPQQLQMRQFTSQIRLVHEDVKPDEKPPEMDELENTRIGTLNQEGLKDDGVVAPPADEPGKGIVVAPKKQEEDWEKVFLKVEIESQYPGGSSAWKRYLERNMRYPQEAQDNGIQGTVVVQFIVDKEGVVSDVEVLSGPQELRAEAVRVIKKSGKWTAAVQNNIKVKSYKTQPVIFMLGTD
jgi:protein TonB